MTLVSELFEIVGSVITSLINALVQAVSGITTIFYDEGSFTFVGTLLLIGLGFTLVFWAFRFIRNLIRR